MDFEVLKIFGWLKDESYFCHKFQNIPILVINYALGWHFWPLGSNGDVILPSKYLGMKVKLEATRTTSGKMTKTEVKNRLNKKRPIEPNFSSLETACRTDLVYPSSYAE